ncbi:MAG: hypothetical protein RL641_139 [Candidatus Parcubacteria bacterium]|jgi:hypothetical protein
MENNDTRKIIKISKKKVTWLVVIVAVIFLGWFVRGYLGTTLGVGPSMGTSSNYRYPGMTMPPMMETDTAGNGMMPDIYPYPYNEQSSYKDTREFLKTNYNAVIYTRHVADVIKDAKNIVKGADGRVDNISSTDKYGYISFVVPKSKFEAFKDEIESLTNEKLVNVSESSTNLLSQKQGIEQQAEDISNNLSALEKAKASLATKHNQTLATLNEQIATKQTEINAKTTEAAASTDQTQKNLLTSQQNTKIWEKSMLEQKKAEENTSYNTQQKNYNNQIAAAKLNQDNNVKQDETFTDNIETVNGTINANWISVWGLAKIFSPVNPTIIVIVLALLVIFYLNRRGYIPKFVFA